MNRPLASRLRQLLCQTEQARERYRDAVLAAGPVVVGAFVTRGRKCGKASCRCTRGELHYSKFIARSVDGRPQQIYVRSGDEVQVATKAESYRRVREARAELMKLAARTAQIIDELVGVLTEPYPPPRPPQTKRRRRHPEDGASGASD